MLRNQLKQRRAALSIVEQNRCSERAIRQLQGSALFRSARNIALYLPVRGEINPSQLLRYGRRGQKFYLPVLSLYKPNGLIFMQWTPETRFRLNRFQIPEPCIQYQYLKSARHMDLVIMPLVAFDNKGHRLGMGGGFYDRSFAFKNGSWQRKRPVLMGIAYQFQQVDALPSQPWDVPLDAVVTETRIKKYRACSYPGSSDRKSLSVIPYRRGVWQI